MKLEEIRKIKFRIFPRHVSWNGMVWPRYLEHEDDSVQWRLRYGIPSKEDLLYAASVMAAYTALVDSTDKKRREVVRILKEVEKEI